MSIPNAAILGAVAMNRVTGVGAPSYTSGTHMWKGTAPSLNATPTTTNTSPSTMVSRMGAGSAIDPATVARSRLPVLP